MSNNKDIIIIGAGFAGLCCAGELVLQGYNPILICEGKEVGAAVRSKMVDGNRGIMQTPTWQIAWGGGWWPKLIRELNVPVTVPDGFGPLDYTLRVRGMDQGVDLPQCAMSGAAVADAILTIFPSLESARVDLDRVLQAALAIPYEELVKMDRVPLVSWLAEQNASEPVVQIMLSLSSALIASSTQFCAEHVSVYATLGYFRSFFCGEGVYGIPFPDLRHGILVPLAKAIEERGGKVLRGRKVSKVNIENGKATGVTMSDGEVINAKLVAMATGNSRIADLIDPVPEEIKPAMDYTKVVEHSNFNIFSVLKKPIVPDNVRPWTCILDPETGSMLHWVHNIHMGAPWAVKNPGQQFITTGIVFQQDKVDEMGGDEAVYEYLQDLVEELYPGYKDAIETTKTFVHHNGHLWYGNCTIGPKLPRTIGSVAGLWFVGEGSTPTEGTYMEAAASAGMLGARGIAEVLGS